MATVKPAIEYYIKQMRTEYFSSLRKGFRAIRSFDPFFVKEKDIVTLIIHLRDLKYLKIKKLNNACINGIIDNELVTLKQECLQCDEEFDLLSGAEEYNKKLSLENNENGTNKTWKDDNSEYARRIWVWWGTSRKHKFAHATKAVKLIGLLQSSSAYIERVFSQLKFILQDIGKVGIQDNIEYRLMRRVNTHI